MFSFVIGTVIGVSTVIYFGLADPGIGIAVASGMISGYAACKVFEK